MHQHSWKRQINEHLEQEEDSGEVANWQNVTPEGNYEERKLIQGVYERGRQR